MNGQTVTRPAFLALSRLQQAALLLLEEEGKIRIENEEVAGLGETGTRQTRQANLHRRQSSAKEASR